MDGATFHLHSYFRSSCSARVRTAAALKDIPLTYSFVHLLQGGHLSNEYASINPSRTVPTLTVSQTDQHGNSKTFSATQSIAILEFLEELFPERNPLLPSKEDFAGRLHVRDMVNVIACDVQPPSNLKVLKRVTELGGESAAWGKRVMSEGLEAYEKLAARSAGRYSYGDSVTLADVVLAPAVENAIRYQVDMSQFPTVSRIFEAIRNLDAFKKGDWRHQDDTPEDLRVKED